MAAWLPLMRAGLRKARLAANQGATGKAEFGQAIEATGCDAASPIANPLAALKERPQREGGA